MPLIVLEGIDGCGKSSLSSYLSKKSAEIYTVSFPSSANPIGKLIKDALTGKEKISRFALLWLFISEGVHVEGEIKNALAHDWLVICDRHTSVSGYVYQSDEHTIESVNNALSLARFTQPDKVFILDVPAKLALERRKQRLIDSTLYEPRSEHLVERQRQKYLEWSSRNPSSQVLDGTMDSGLLSQMVLNDEILQSWRIRHGV